jgi:hypothetical protein
LAAKYSSFASGVTCPPKPDPQNYLESLEWIRPGRLWPRSLNDSTRCSGFQLWSLIAVSLSNTRKSEAAKIEDYRMNAAKCRACWPQEHHASVWSLLTGGHFFDKEGFNGIPYLRKNCLNSWIGKEMSN